MQTIKEESIELQVKSSEPKNSDFTEYTEQEFNRLINKDRINNMESKMKHIKDRITHLISVRDRWRYAHFTLRIIGVITTSIFTLTTTVINVLPENTVNLPLVRLMTALLSSLTAITLATTEGTAGGFTYRNFEKYNKKIRGLENHINKCWMIYEKARKDRIIDDKELDLFFDTLKEEDEFVSISLE